MFVVKEEEEFPADDGATDRAAELVEVDVRRRRVRAEGVVVGVQRRVLEVFIRRTVKTIRAALADLVIENAAYAVLRRKGGAAGLHFLKVLLDRDIGVRACRQSGFRSVCQYRAERQIAVDREHGAIRRACADTSLTTHRGACGTCLQNIEA